MVVEDILDGGGGGINRLSFESENLDALRSLSLENSKSLLASPASWNRLLLANMSDPLISRSLLASALMSLYLVLYGGLRS